MKFQQAAIRLVVIGSIAAVRTVAASADAGVDDGGETKIIGGKPALYGEFPAFAQPVYPGECRNSCGGTLIHPDIVMSAAHCKGRWIEAGQVAIGATTLCGTDATETLTVVAEYNHPLYGVPPPDSRNDISLIKLSNASTATPATWNRDSYTPASQSLVTACGLGVTSTGSTDILLKTTVRTIANYVCVDQYESIQDAEVDPAYHLCAAGMNKGVCYGDSGGPLFLFGTNIVVGITSYGIGCADPNYSQVYTRVSTFDRWIKSTICQVSDVTPTAFSCGPSCGDGICDNVIGEYCSSCTADCGPCVTIEASCPGGINDTGLAMNGIGASIRYDINVRAGDRIVCTISGGTGDADLRVRLDDFSCNSNEDGNMDSCSTPSATAYTFQADVGVVVSKPFSGVTLVCTCETYIPQCNDGICTDDETCATCPSDCGDCPPTCADGIHATGLRAFSDPLLFNISVSVGDSVECMTSGGISGDVLLVVMWAQYGVPCESDSDINGSLTNEICDILDIYEDGTASVSVYPLSPFSDVSLVCTCIPVSEPEQPPDGFPFDIPILGPLLKFLFHLIFPWA